MEWGASELFPHPRSNAAEGMATGTASLRGTSLRESTLRCNHSDPPATQDGISMRTRPDDRAICLLYTSPSPRDRSLS
eukprot:7486240-Pyramimonas_sp.AAC.1